MSCYFFPTSGRMLVRKYCGVKPC